MSTAISTMTMPSMHEILKQTFGYSEFRPQQEEIIDHILHGKDSLVIMPTGGGKSICYQVPALLQEGMAIVVSPLIALMNDQVLALQQLGVQTEAIHSNHSEDKLRSIIKQIAQNKIKLLYVSPERLINSRFLTFLRDKLISFIAVDEAHCVSVWGNDFRPDYAALSILRETFKGKPLMALTATADKATQDDIVSQLRMSDPKSFVTSFERKNIYIEVRPAYRRKEQIIQFIRQRLASSGIVYCLSRKSCQKMSQDLENVGIKAGFYHAGMDAAARSRIQQEFQEDKINVICATIAFGMGIDKSNIKWVVHYNMPKNLESYYQEIGRSGRDGTPAEALLFYGWGDFQQYKRFIDESEANQQFKYVQNAKLQRMWEYVSTSDCRVNLVLNYFGEYRSKPCNHCDNCSSPPEKMDGKIIAQKAISAVARANESLGLNLLIDVLRGSYKREIRDLGLDSIKTFGAGRELPYIAWKEYITQLIDKGLLRIDYTDKMHLKLTPLSLKTIKSNQPIQLKKFVKHTDKEQDTQKKIRFKKKTAKELIAEDLIALLKEWREKKALSIGVPAYIVLTDKVIQEISIEKPMFYKDLAKIEGFGAKRLEDFAGDLLPLLQSYFINQTHHKSLKGKTYLETYQQQKNGKKPEEIAAQKKVHVNTIYTHFAKLYEEYEAIELSPYITDQEIEIVGKAIRKSGGSLELGILYDHIQVPMEGYKVKMAIAIITRQPKEYLL